MANNQFTAPQFSECIEDFLSMARSAISDYEWNGQQISLLDKETQDYLHSLELDGLTYNERAKVATKLANCRRLRRISKNTVEILSPLVDFLISPTGKSVINNMQEILGRTRKVEKLQEKRTYRCKVINKEDKSNGYK